MYIGLQISVSCCFVSRQKETRPSRDFPSHLPFTNNTSHISEHQVVSLNRQLSRTLVEVIMARHATQNTQAGRKTAAPAKHDGLMNKTSRLDVNTTTIAQHPVKEPKSVQKPEKHRKPRETVSAAGVFKKSKSKHEKKNSRRHREKTPEHELFLNITGSSSIPLKLKVQC